MLPVLKKIEDFECVFPHKWQEVVFRNYGKIKVLNIAKILGTTEREIERAAKNLGLSGVTFSEKWQKFGYVTLIYDNWKILPYSQLVALLGITEEKLEWILKEEDFLGEVLGGFKPDVQEVKYREEENTPFKYKEYAESLRLGEERAFDFGYGKVNNGTVLYKNETGLDLGDIGKVVFGAYGNSKKTAPVLMADKSLAGESFSVNGGIIRAGEKTGFLRGLQAYYGDEILDGVYVPRIKTRIVYGYETGCGDILDIDIEEAFSEELLTGLFRCKVNGIFLHAVFYQLCKFPFDPKIGADYLSRLNKLREITERCDKYGIKIYLYINEPRCMPKEFFDGREDLSGQIHGDFGALCTSVPAVRDYLKNAAKEIAESLPLLGGMISITMSENLTNCYSKGQCACGRCKERKMTDVVAEVNNLINAGLKEAKTGAKLIAWTWAWFPVLGWNDERIKECISKHDKDIAVMCTSEDHLVTEDGDAVGDYSVAHIGPSDKTRGCAKLIKGENRKLFLKIQTNDSWECPSVPYLPVYPLQTENVKRSVEIGADGLVMSWTMGGYPSKALETCGNICVYGASYDEVVKKRFEKASRGDANAYKKLSDAFSSMPYSGMYLYVGPMARGPALKFVKEKRSEQSSMIGYVYDDADYWFTGTDKTRYMKKFRKMIDAFENAVSDIPDEEDKRMATAAACVFNSAYNYTEFAETKNSEILKREYKNVTTLFPLMLKDGRIGYETSKRYLYSARSVAEKLIQLKSEIDK